MKLTDSQIETIRTRPQLTRLYLSIFQPRTVMQAQVNDSTITKGARTIKYNNVTLGSYIDVEAGMTLLIGTSIGGSDVGRLRIRSADATQFIVSENSNINWSNGLYLTVLRYWEVWPVFPRIIQKPGDPTDVIFYKDYDIPYSNQNSVLGTFVNAGPNRAAFLDGGITQLWYSSTGTLNLGTGTSLLYYWTFEGGTPTGSNLADPGWVTYSVPGHYITRLAISGSNGESDVTYRCISIYDRPSAGNHPPIEKWELVTMDGSKSEGGINSVTLKIYDNIQISDNAVIVIFAEDWYGGTQQSLGGNYPNASQIFFTGYVEKDTIQYDYQKSYIQFNVTGPTGLMKNAVGFSVSVQSDRAPDTWYKISDLDCKRAMYHYLRWHTTILNVADFQFVGDDRKLQYFDADRSSMFDAVDNFLKGTLIGGLTSDRQGKLWAEVDASAYPNPTGTFQPIMSISKRDWMQEPQIEERVQDEASYIEYGGIAYSGIVTGTFQALLAGAPGNAPSFRGKANSTVEGLALYDQAQLNQLVGNILANKNAKIKSVRLNITENLRNLDLAPQEAVAIHVDAQDTNKGVPLDVLGIPDNFSWTYDAQHGLLVPVITFNPLVSGNPGDGIPIPPPDSIGKGFKLPKIILPPPSTTGTGSLNGVPFIRLNSSAGTSAGMDTSFGAWSSFAADVSGLWVTVLYTGLWLITAKCTVTLGSALNPGTAWIALRSTGWGQIFESTQAPLTANPSPPPSNLFTFQYDATISAIVELQSGQTIGIGVDNSVGDQCTLRKLQLVLLSYQ